MPEISTKVNITIGNSVLEFSGSEAFVQKQIDEFKELICSHLKSEKGKKPKTKMPQEQPDQDDSSRTLTPDTSYPNVIDYHGKNVGIIKVIGKNTREKTRNIVLMYTYAKKKLGIDKVNKKELIALCKEHECYDQANFKTILKKAPGIAIDGSKKDYTVRLTVPGMSKAKELLDTLEGDSNK